MSAYEMSLSTLTSPMPWTDLDAAAGHPQLQHLDLSRTGFGRDSGHERTLKLQKEIQVSWKLPKQKDFYILINGSFNQIVCG